MQLYLRYNAQEGRHSEAIVDSIDSLLVDGPNLTYYQTAFSELLKKTKKDYIIEPHTFHLHEDKESHTRYMSEAGIDGKLFNKSLAPQTRKDVVKALLEFQKGKVNDIFSEDALEETEATFSPKYLIAPYDLISQSGESSVGLNIKLIEDAKEAYPSEKIYASIILSKELLLEEQFIEQICGRYKTAIMDGICFGVGDFNPIEDAEEYLVGYAHFVNTLSTIKKPMISLYGTFFDVLLNNPYFEAIVHGLDSGEKLTLAAGAFGRRPNKRKYIYGLKKKFAGADLDFISVRAPELMNCGCAFCKDQAHATRADLIKHYIMARKNEIEEANNGFDHLDFINSAYEKYSKPDKLKILKLDYLKRWSTALSNAEE